jgi:rod shape-determining protein MreB
MSQPSYIAFNTEGHTVKAIGDQAYCMFEKTHEDLRSIKPLRGGVIADFDSASKMIAEMLSQVFAKRSLFGGYNNIVSGVPFSTTEVERRALRSALEQFNARHTYLLYEPLAAAMGMGLDIREPDGKMIVDIGGGITEIVVISLSGVASFQSVKVAGDTFDSEIQDYFRRSFNMSIGLKTAEQIKLNVGAVVEKLKSAPEPMVVKGKDMVTGIPMTRKIAHPEVAFIIEKSVSVIENNIIQTMETCSPELAADIYQNGVHVTGGGALLRGIKERFESRLKVPVHIDEQALTSVSRGVAKALSDTKKFRSVLFE